MMNLTDCIALAEFAHRNQIDKAGMPYIEHPKRVMQNVQAQGAIPYVQMAAVLHDVTEDTPFTPDMLKDLGVPEAAVNIVRLLDRNLSKTIYQNCGDHQQYEINGEMKSIYYPDSENYMTQDEYYYACIKNNPGALQVKLADIGDNMQPWRLAYLPPETQNRLRAKYTAAINMLNPKQPNYGFIDPNYSFNPYVPGGRS